MSVVSFRFSLPNVKGGVTTGRARDWDLQTLWKIDKNKEQGRHRKGMVEWQHCYPQMEAESRNKKEFAKMGF